MTASDPDLDCPMRVAGTSVRTEETVSGPALAFTTTGDVDELRMRVRRMAAANNRALSDRQAALQSKPKADPESGFPNTSSNSTRPDSAAVPNMYSADSHAAPGGSTSTQSDMLHEMQGTPGQPAKPGAASQPAQARAENTESGSRLVFVVDDASQLERARDRVQTSAQMLSSGRCPALAAQGGNTATPSFEKPAAGGY